MMEEGRERAEKTHNTTHSQIHEEVAGSGSVARREKRLRDWAQGKFRFKLKVSWVNRLAKFPDFWLPDALFVA